MLGLRPTPARCPPRPIPRVRQRRLDLKDTHEAVCARIQINTGNRWEVDHRDLWKIEAQRRACTDVEIVELAKALEVEAGWLMESRSPK